MKLEATREWHGLGPENSDYSGGCLKAVDITIWIDNDLSIYVVCDELEPLADFAPSASFEDSPDASSSFHFFLFREDSYGCASRGVCGDRSHQQGPPLPQEPQPYTVVFSADVVEGGVAPDVFPHHLLRGVLQQQMDQLEIGGGSPAGVVQGCLVAVVHDGQHLPRTASHFYHKESDHVRTPPAARQV